MAKQLLVRNDVTSKDTDELFKLRRAVVRLIEKIDKELYIRLDKLEKSQTKSKK
jgi:hypothetical protein